MLDLAPGADGPPGLADFARAYRNGKKSPLEVLEATTAAVREADRADPPLRAVITLCEERARGEAARSAERWKRGAPLSPLDGVPILVKDNTDVAGVPITNGTAIAFPLPALDARVVARLVAAGAVVIGKANQCEIGAGATGINVHHGTARNPHDPARWCGGSSSGSASAVAAGLVPLSVATDAGGSVRAPAAFVGAVGLKPTFGRISRIGMSILCDTLDHYGSITHSCGDAAAALCAMSGIEADDQETWDQPPLPDIGAALAALEEPLAGLRVGVASGVFSHPRVDPAMGEHIARAAEALAAAGARLADVEVPDLDTCLMVGLVLLAAEGPSGMEEILEAQHHKLGADLQVLLRCGEHVSARDYLKAQRIRQQIRHSWRAILDEVDVVLMPATGQVAGILRKDAIKVGEVDEWSSSRAIVCTFPQNLTGFPAVSVPCGRIGALPVSAQVIAPPWQELRALRAAAAIERAGLYAWRRPVRYLGDRIL
jgi:Asp-tRNA(Asn)/Glu-tRNA(Gln) amidotransferase A subunit family amidase